MTDDQRNAALQAEYLHLQKTIEDFDARALTIKAWSVTFGMVALTGAFTSRVSLVFIIAAIGAAMFWLLEIQWKLFQNAYNRRTYQIESHFRGEVFLEYPFQITASWHQASARNNPREIAKIIGWSHVYFPHIVVILSGIWLYYRWTF